MSDFEEENGMIFYDDANDKSTSIEISYVLPKLVMYKMSYIVIYSLDK